MRISFRASTSPTALAAYTALAARYGDEPVKSAETIVALGGDGFMLQTLHETQSLNLPVYGMNCGTIGFLMNAYNEDALEARLRAAEETVINPLAMTAVAANGRQHHALAINQRGWARADAGTGLRWGIALHARGLHRL